MDNSQVELQFGVGLIKQQALHKNIKVIHTLGYISFWVAGSLLIWKVGLSQFSKSTTEFDFWF